MAVTGYTFMMKHFDGDALAIMRDAQAKAKGEGRAMKFVVLQLLKGWVAGYYQLGAAKK